MKSAHTPGPWFSVKNNCYWEIRTEDRNHEGEQIGDACSSKFIDGHDDNPVAEDNARLMAAAPELLEALQGMLEVYGVREVSPNNNATLVEVELCDMARTAIEKATGA